MKTLNNIHEITTFVGFNELSEMRNDQQIFISWYNKPFVKTTSGDILVGFYDNDFDIQELNCFAEMKTVSRKKRVDFSNIHKEEI